MYKYILLTSFLGMWIFNCEKTTPTVTEDAADYYTEQHRPQLHFSPDSKWMNDPNGMVYYEGEYHLFYQYYPDSTVWGPMHWGHAVSEDLIHWEHLPVALYPDSLGYIFSGSAVIDWDNTSGLGQEGQPPMVAIFTYHDPVGEKAGRNDFQTQGIAYSNDKGRTWTKYAGNPVIKNPGIRDFRDPKVIWDEGSQQWVMVFAAYDHVKFYGSPNLKDWTHLSDFGQNWGTHAGVWECPELFPTKNEDTGATEWVLLVSINPGSPNGGSGTQYFIGDFDGTNFTLAADFKSHLGVSAAKVPAGNVFADFENGYGAWTTTGTAFGEQPASGSLPQQNEVTNYQGQSLVNSFKGGEAATGTLTSPKFLIEQSYINFQIAGGNSVEEVYVELLIDGKTIHRTAGSNSGKLSWAAWNVTEWLGQEAQIQVVDQRTDSWGHICVDHFFFSEEAAQPASEKAVWLDYGRDNYAGVTWSDVPAEDGRRIFMGWMSNWDYAMVVPTEKWRSAMTLPRILKLKNTAAGSRIVQSLPEEFNQLREEAISINTKEVTRVNIAASPQQLEIELTAKVNTDEDGELRFLLSNDQGEEYVLSYNLAENTFISDRRRAGKHDFSYRFATSAHRAPRLSTSESLNLRVVFDRSSVELLADDGQVAITDVFFPSEGFNDIEVSWSSKGIEIEKLTAYPLQRIW